MYAFIDIMNSDSMYLSRGDYTTLKDYLHFSDLDVGIYDFTVADMDDDQIPEVIIYLTVGGLCVVFHYDENGVTGDLFSNREFMQPKKDGTFMSTGGSAYTNFNRLTYEDGIYKIVKLAYSDTVEDKEGMLSPLYYISDELVTKEEFTFFWDSFDRKDDLEWYPYSEETFERDFIAVWNEVVSDAD